MYRGCHLKYSIHSEELSSILLRHRVKKIPRFSIHTIPESKRIEKPDTCIRKQKGAFLKMSEIRVDRAYNDT